MRITLLCLDPGVPLGGAKGCSVHLRAVAGALLGAGHAVHALVAEAGPPAGYAALAAAGLEVRALASPPAAAELESALEAARPDVVLERLSLVVPHGARAAERLGLTHLFEVNAPLDEEAAAYRRLADPDATRAALAAALAGSAGAVAVSHEVATWVRRLAGDSFPVKVVPNGADASFLEPPAAEALERARRSAGDGSGFRVGYLGSFKPWHDLPGLLRAAARLPAGIGTRLLLVGDGPCRDQILHEAGRLGLRVAAPGAVAHDDVPAYLALCDAVAIPYARADAYFSPLKLVEAMAAGRAVVASATGPCARLIAHGREGLLVQPGDDAALAGALERLAGDGDLRERLGAAARDAVRRRHTWDAVVGEVVDFARACARALGRP